MSAWFAFLIRLFPARFRRVFGASMHETLMARHAELRARGRLAGVRSVLTLTMHVVRAAVAERLAGTGSGAVSGASVHGAPSLSAGSPDIAPTRRYRGNPMDTIRQDLAFAFRTLRRSRMFAVVAVFTLALGIGASTTIFSVLEATLLRPWPLPEQDRVVVPVTRDLESGSIWSVNYADYEDWLDAGVFEHVGVYYGSAVDLAGSDGVPERVPAVGVSDGFFGALGLPTELGRYPTPDEYTDGSPTLVVLAHSIWRDRYGGDESIVGNTIRISGTEATVIGVMSADAGVLDGDLFVPMRPTPEALVDMRDRDNFQFNAIARLAAGRSIDATRAELSAISNRIVEENPQLRAGTTVDVMPLSRMAVGEEARLVMFVLLGAVGLVLLIGCANVANLLVARGIGRTREIAVRAAMGASRLRLIRQLLVESMVVALAAGAGGIAIAALGVRFLVTMAPSDLPRLDAVGLNPVVVGFALAISAASALVFGLLPALRSAASSQASVLTERAAGAGAGTGARGTHGVRRGRRGRGALVVAEVALTVVLLAGAGLMLRSLMRVASADPGFQVDGLVAFQVSLPGRYPDADALIVAYDELRDRIASVPGVQSVTMTNSLPLDGGGLYLGRSFLPEGRPEPPAGEEVSAQWAVAPPGYFQTMGLPTIAGRVFNDSDTQESVPIMIVNREFARLMFGDPAEALGKRVRSWRDENVYREVVGVVEDTRYFGAGEDVIGVVYVPYRQNPWRSLMIVARVGAGGSGGSAGAGAAAGIATGGATPPMRSASGGDLSNAQLTTIIGPLRRALADFDSELAAADFTTMRGAFDQSIAPRRFAATLLTLFAALALTLAGLGIYGVLSFAVAQRTQEFGIRMALGAAARDVRTMVLRQAGLLIALGGLAGVIAAFGLTRVLSAVLFDVGATDPLTFLAAIGVLGAVGLLASWVPALRATRMDPVRAIRSE